MERLHNYREDPDPHRGAGNPVYHLRIHLVSE